MNPCPNCRNTEPIEQEIWGGQFFPHTNSFGFCYVCPECRFRSEPKGTKIAAKAQWNRGNGQIFKTITYKQRRSFVSKLFRRLFRWLHMQPNKNQTKMLTERKDILK